MERNRAHQIVLVVGCWQLGCVQDQPPWLQSGGAPSAEQGEATGRSMTNHVLALSRIGAGDYS
eukprot:11577463-Alexandrium_andersonii.AAC.1